jgi:hypothetical protein
LSDVRVERGEDMELCRFAFGLNDDMSATSAILTKQKVAA